MKTWPTAYSHGVSCAYLVANRAKTGDESLRLSFVVALEKKGRNGFIEREYEFAHSADWNVLRFTPVKKHFTPQLLHLADGGRKTTISHA